MGRGAKILRNPAAKTSMSRYLRNLVAYCIHQIGIGAAGKPYTFSATITVVVQWIFALFPQ